MAERWIVTSIVPSPDEMFLVVLRRAYAAGAALSPNKVPSCGAIKTKGWRAGDLPELSSTDRHSCNTGHCTRENRAGIVGMIEATDQIGGRHGRISAEHPHEVGGERRLRLAARLFPTLLIEIQ